MLPWAFHQHDRHTRHRNDMRCNVVLTRCIAFQLAVETTSFPTLPLLHVRCTLQQHHCPKTAALPSDLQPEELTTAFPPHDGTDSPTLFDYRSKTPVAKRCFGSCLGNSLPTEVDNQILAQLRQRTSRARLRFSGCFPPAQAGIGHRLRLAARHLCRPPGRRHLTLK